MFTTKLDKITIEQENIVMKHVNPNLFNLELIISYLNDNDAIEKDIFTTCLTAKGKQTVRFTFLNEYVPVNRDTFIKRIPIYFYGVKNLDENAEQYDIGDLFESYKNYLKAYELDEDDNEDFPFFIDDEKRYSGVDYETLYQMLESTYNYYGIPLDKTLDYLIQQVGELDFEILNYWFKYIELVENLNEGNVFPKNILYSLNVELEKHGYETIIHLPLDYKLMDATSNGRKLLLRGRFPFDENNNLKIEWVGLWFENINSIKLRTRKALSNNRIPLFIKNRLEAVLESQIAIDLNNESLVYIAKHEIDEEDVDSILWEQIYCGAKITEFDFTVIPNKRESLGLSQKEVAEKLEISLRTYQRIEVGEATPDGLNLIKIMNYLGIDSYEEFILKKNIYDDGFDKFKSGYKPSCFRKSNEWEE